MIRSQLSPRPRERGGALAEIALVLPLLLLGVIGTVDFGRVYYESMALESAARNGAQYGAHSPQNAADTTGIVQAVEAELNASIGATGVTIVAQRHCTCGSSSPIDCDADTCGAGAGTKRTYVRVQVDKPFITLVDYPYLPHTIPLTRSAEIRAS